jgi:hypothetical protein
VGEGRIQRLLRLPARRAGTPFHCRRRGGDAFRDQTLLGLHFAKDALLPPDTVREFGRLFSDRQIADYGPPRSIGERAAREDAVAAIALVTPMLDLIAACDPAAAQAAEGLRAEIAALERLLAPG